MSRLLAYLCRQLFAGHAAELTEYTIAIEALGRGPTFDPERDSIVRVEVSRLRKRLAQYYAGDGAGHQTRIVLPEGGYAPEFVAQVPAGTATSEGAAEEQASPASVHPAAAEPAASRRTALITSRRLLIGAVLGICVMAVSLGLWRMRAGQRSVRAEAEAPAARPTQVPPSGPEDGGVRILAGYTDAKYVDRLGRTWLGDRYFTGGNAITRPKRRFFGTQDGTLYSSVRSGEFRYDIPLKPGVYELRLHFSEFWDVNFRLDSDGEDTRRFRVLMNGTPILENFDIVADAYGPDTADEKVFKNVSPASDGFLHLQFASDPMGSNVPILNGIEVLPGVRGKMLPVRILCGAASYYDPDTHSLGADRYFLGGVALNRFVRTEGSAAEAPSAERYGNFRYVIPVADGSYSVSMRFVEAVFGATHPGPGEGKRVFNVYCDGQALLRNFDIFKEAAGAGIPVVRTFRHLRSNSQGKLVFSFVPVKNYAAVTAIEVEDEGLP